MFKVPGSRLRDKTGLCTLNFEPSSAPGALNFLALVGEIVDEQVFP